MRAVTVRMSTDRGWFHPFHEAVVASEAVHREAIHELRLLDDGTALTLFEYSGDLETLADAAAAFFDPAGADYQVTTSGSSLLAFVHFRSDETLADVLRLFRRRTFVATMPVRFARDGSLRITFVDETCEIRRAAEDLPDGVSVSVERTGDYEAGVPSAFATLTDRERRTLETAHDLGYFRNPRGANYEEIAEELDCSVSTVGQHLRNAEAKLMETLLGGGVDDRTG